MCGIAGFAGSLQQLDVPCLASTLLGRLEHRGPDDYGWLTWAPGAVQRGRGPVPGGDAAAVLLHRRLSILDLSASGWQPMSTPDDRFHIAFNGEVYNYRELRAELQTLGYEFRSASDTEVLLAAYAAWGQGALHRLVGMFAFALLDTYQQKLLLARDFFGIKPLFYVWGSGWFAFASEIRSLLELPLVARQVNPARLLDYLQSSLTDHDGETLFASVRQIPAAHYMEIALDRPGESAAPVRYWDLNLNQRLDISFTEAARQLRERFLDNIRLHLRSDVPVGAALSGGLDSSAIVMAMRRLQGPALDIHTFSYVADDAEINEEPWVNIVGQAARTTVHKVRARPQELVADLDRLVSIQDVPFGGTSIYAQHRVFRLAREVGIKVMLDGQGADELFAGYRTYLSARLGSLLQSHRWREAWQMLRQAARLPGVGARGALSQLRTLPQLSSLRHCVKRVTRGKAGQPWLNHEWFRRRNALSGSRRLAADGDLLRQELHRTLVQTSLPMLLRYEDRNSMAFSIESRVPFLTPGLAQFVLALPEEYFIAPDGTSKWVFREAMRGIVPDAILDRRDKIGFATPESRWLGVLRPWVERVLDSDRARQIEVLDHQRVWREWQAILERRQRFDFRVWRWVNLILWAEQFDVVFD